MNGLKILCYKKAVKHINSLIKDIKRNHFTEFGKPETLKHDLSSFWSRRKGENHTIVYRVENSVIYIISCKGHYNS